MARDFRTPKAGNNRCLYYDGKYVKNKTKLEQDTIAKGVFYANVVVPFVEKQENNGVVASTSKKGKVITYDYVPDIIINSYVLFENELYLVEEISREEKQIKAIGNRKATVTTIGLRR